MVGEPAWAYDVAKAQTLASERTWMDQNSFRILWISPWVHNYFFIYKALPWVFYDDDIMDKGVK